MPKVIPEQELNAIARIVANHHPDQVQAKTIRNELEIDFPPRKLQRRLALLVEQKRFAINGRGRGSRYRLPTITGKNIKKYWGTLKL